MWLCPLPNPLMGSEWHCCRVALVPHQELHLKQVSLFPPALRGAPGCAWPKSQAALWALALLLLQGNVV